MKKAVLAAFVLFQAQLSALLGCGEFTLSLDYLYWKPAGVSQQLGTVQRNIDGINHITRAIVNPTYSSGIRGELAWSPCACPLGLVGRYTWVEPRHAQTFHGDFGSFVKASLETKYHAGDLYLRYCLTSWRCFDLDLLAGGNFLYFAEVANGVGNASLSDRHVRFAGGGGSIGLGGIWLLPCSLEAFAEARFGLLMGSRRDAFFFSNIFLTPVSNQEWTREIGLRFGGRYVWCEFGLELGWEMRSYLDLLYSQHSFADDAIARGKSIGGPFLGLTWTF